MDEKYVWIVKNNNHIYCSDVMNKIYNNIMFTSEIYHCKEDDVYIDNLGILYFSGYHHSVWLLGFSDINLDETDTLVIDNKRHYKWYKDHLNTIQYNEKLGLLKQEFSTYENIFQKFINKMTCGKYCKNYIKPKIILKTNSALFYKDEYVNVSMSNFILTDIKNDILYI